MIGVRNRCDISQIRLGRGVVCLFSFGNIVEQGGLYRFLGAGVVGWFPNTLSVRFLNSNSSKMGLSFSLFTGSRRSDFSSKVKGTSVLMVAKNLENSICERFSSTLVFKAPFNRSVFASRFSIPPKSAISLTAVFSPTRDSRVCCRSCRPSILICR